MKSKKKMIVFIALLTLIVVIGSSYAIYLREDIGANQQLITGDIYMNYIEGNSVINLSNMLPMSKSDALLRNDNVFNFQVTGKNTSDKTIYYGISLVDGDVVTGKTRINTEDIAVYLTSGQDVLVNGLRYKNFDGKHIYVDSIPPGTNSYTKNYSLRLWIDESVLIGDPNEGAKYTETQWNNLYASAKVQVDGNLDDMNVSLYVDSNKYVENNKQYVIATIRNFYNPLEEGESLSENDTMRLQVSATNTTFSYKDAIGGESQSDSSSLDITYTFNRKRSLDIHIFMTPTNHIDTNTDVTIRLTKNNSEVYEIVYNIDLVGDSWCLTNGYTKLNECVLASDNLSSSVQAAKSYIASKGSPNLDSTSPSFTYDYTLDSTITENAITMSTTDESYYYETMEFDRTNGIFTLSDIFYQGTSVSNDLIGLYVCPTGGRTCDTMYQITGVHTDTNKIDGYKRQSYQIGSLANEVGLYRVNGNASNKYNYIFRGAVNNNNVKFGDTYWKIVRVNEDDTIRMIYNGTTLSNDGNLTAGNKTVIYRTGYPYNYTNSGPTYNGFMYNENNQPTESQSVRSSPFNATRNIYWGEDYDVLPKDENGVTKYRLKVGSNNYPLVQYTLSQINTATGLNNNNETVPQLSLTPYTCNITDSTGTCDVLIKVDSVITSIWAYVHYITMSPTTLEATQSNVYNSNALKMLNKWYEEVFSLEQNNSKSVTTYLADEVFCNDRSATDSTYNSRYLLHLQTNFGGYSRLNSNSKTATLACANKNDAFTVSDTTNGNGKLDYPVGLITADEVALAGGKLSTNNTSFYLKSGTLYWTMTPFWYTQGTPSTTMFAIGQNGNVSHSAITSPSFGLRPVINLKADVTISSGDGTPTNPFIIN